MNTRPHWLMRRKPRAPEGWSPNTYWAARPLRIGAVVEDPARGRGVVVLTPEGKPARVRWADTGEITDFVRGTPDGR